jgi:peptidoglycan/LPS O-acetylase OafA/YrhL
MLLGALLSLPVAAKLGERVNSILLVNPLLRSMEFLSGMVLGFLYLKHFSIVSLDRKTSGTMIILLCLIAICSVMTIFSAEKQWMNIAFTTPFLGIIILNLALFNSWWGLENKYMVLLGDSSYCMYIIHGPINMWFHQAIRFDLFTLPGSAILMIYLFTVIAISMLIHQYFERPVNQYIRRRLLAGRN